jgi:hypothetical protein
MKSEAERVTESIELLEMANAIQKYTGLPGVVYFCTKEEMRNPQSHALGRIKWINSGEEVSVSILPGKDGLRKSAGDNKRMIMQLARFAAANQDLFWTYWNTPKDEADSAALFSQIKRYA